MPIVDWDNNFGVYCNPWLFGQCPDPILATRQTYMPVSWLCHGWHPCSSLSMSPRPALRMTTWFPQRMQPCCPDNSSFLVVIGLSCTSCTKSGQPLCTNCQTLTEEVWICPYSNSFCSDWSSVHLLHHLDHSRRKRCYMYLRWVWKWKPTH